MTVPLFVEIEGGIELCVPRSLETITTYVALEQEDWFESEIGFVRRLLRPGMCAIDIGANYGVYALTMAKAVGAAGRVLCVEPASETASFLRAGIERNRFANVELQQCALSAAPGRRRLKLEASSELNRLADDDSGDGEPVTVETLDRLTEALPPGTVELVKIDAEGEERNILSGGARMLERHSPLVMFERMHGAEVNAGVIDALRQSGFALYRLVPGLGMLVPFDEAGADRFQLNLFACRADRAARLEQADLLCATVPPQRARPGVWAGSLGQQPFFRGFADRAAAPAADAGAAQYRSGLDLYAVAMDDLAPAAARWSALRHGLAVLLGAVSNNPTALRMMTLARIAGEAGERDLAVQALSKLPLDPAAYDPGAVSEPFMPACPRFDRIDPGNEFGLWCAVSIFEQFETLRAFSSRYTSDDSLRFFDAFRPTRFFSPEMERRRQLIRMRTGRQSGPEPHPLLAARGPAHRNVAYWTSRADDRA